MRYHNITDCDMLNGEGLRVVLWLSHCEHKCFNCQNPQTWDCQSGIPFDEKAKQELFEKLDNEYISGLTLSGGDPLSLLNRAELGTLLQEVKIKFPNKNIWLYTGYSWCEIEHLKLLEYVDVLVDGEYIEKLSIPTPKWRGSKNQRIIDIKESLIKGRVIEYIYG